MRYKKSQGSSRRVRVHQARLRLRSPCCAHSYRRCELGHGFGKSITFNQAKKNKDEDDSSRDYVSTKQVDHLSSCVALSRAATFTAVFPWRAISAACGSPGLLWSTHALQRFLDFGQDSGLEP